MFEEREFGLAAVIRSWAAACLVIAALCLGGSSAQAQSREEVGQTLNDLFITIYRNSGVMNGIFENCAFVPGAAGEFFNAVHKRYVRNDTVIAGMIVAVHRKVMERQVATGAVGLVEQLSKDSRDLAYSEIKRKFIVANGEAGTRAQAVQRAAGAIPDGEVGQSAVRGGIFRAARGFRPPDIC